MAWPRFVLNSTQPQFELSELLQWGECGATAEPQRSERAKEKESSLRCGSALSPLKELRQFELRLCAVQNKSRQGHVEYDEERES